MRTLLRRCCALGLAAALACGGEDIVHEGEHVTLVIDPAVEACGDMVGHMDRFVATLAKYLGVSLAEEQYDFIWYSEERFAAEANCGSYNGWCSGGGLVRSTVAPLDLALARLIFGRLGAPPPFFLEGALVAFAPDPYLYGSGYPGDGDVQQTLALGAVDQVLGGAFTRFLIDRHGLAAYLAFYARVGERDSLPEIEAVHLAQFGESMTETILAFDIGGRSCPTDRFRLKLLECSAPSIAWDGDSLLLRRSLACGDDDVIGPFHDSRLQSLSTLEVATAGTFELSVAGDDPARAWLAGCGGCEDEASASVVVGGEPVRLWLPAGRYYLDLAAYAGRSTSVALRIERIDEP